MKTIELTIQEIWMQTKPKIHSNKKKYNRKDKHKKKRDQY